MYIIMNVKSTCLVVGFVPSWTLGNSAIQRWGGPTLFPAGAPLSCGGGIDRAQVDISFIPAPDTLPRLFAHLHQFRFGLLDAPAALGCHFAEEEVRMAAAWAFSAAGGRSALRLNDTLSPAAGKRIVAAQRARWARVKAAKEGAWVPQGRDSGTFNLHSAVS